MATEDTIITAHAAARLKERGISLDSVRDVIKYGKKAKQAIGSHGGQVWKMSKTVENTTLVAVVEIKGKERWLITAYEK